MKIIREDLFSGKTPDDLIKDLVEYIEGDNWSFKSNTSQAYTLYETIVTIYPHIKEILEKVFKTNPRYALHSMWKHRKEITFYFYQSMSCDMVLYHEILKKYGVSFQVPGNQDYNFSISIRVK